MDWLLVGRAFCFHQVELKWSFPLKYSGRLAPDVDSWRVLALLSGVHADYPHPFCPIKLEQWKKISSAALW